MVDGFISFINSASFSLARAIFALFIPIVFFGLLALIIKGRRFVDDTRQAVPEIRVNILLFIFNTIFIVPLLAIFATAMKNGFTVLGIHSVGESVWAQLPSFIVIFAAIFVGDFIGYWRHRFEHSTLLWPSHAIHHSDTRMTWFTLERFHPINRLTTLALDTASLLLLGFPPYAVIANGLVRHYYGYFIHADLPWTYGFLGRVFVSPAMHRWHHAVDETAYQTNFATVFSVFDQIFGTFRVPGPCKCPLGIAENMGAGFFGQLSYPLKRRAYRRSSENSTRAAAK